MSHSLELGDINVQGTVEAVKYGQRRNGVSNASQGVGTDVQGLELGDINVEGTVRFPSSICKFQRQERRVKVNEKMHGQERNDRAKFEPSSSQGRR